MTKNIFIQVVSVAPNSFAISSLYALEKIKNDLIFEELQGVPKNNPQRSTVYSEDNFRLNESNLSISKKLQLYKQFFHYNF